MNTERGEFVQLSSNIGRTGIIVNGYAHTRVVLWLDDFTFSDIRFSQLVEGQKPPTNKQSTPSAPNALLVSDDAQCVTAPNKSQPESVMPSWCTRGICYSNNQYCISLSYNVKCRYDNRA